MANVWLFCIPNSSFELRPFTKFEFSVEAITFMSRKKGKLANSA